MPREIISNFKIFQKKFPRMTSSHPRTKALKAYLSRGGVINAVKSSNPWPKLVYPTPLRLKQQISELEQAIQSIELKKRDWEKRHFQARIYNTRNSLLKFLDPLYWQHLTKTLTDKDYKNDAQAVQLPVEMVAEPRYRPMINMFVKDLEYRKQLTETVQNSIVYKKDKRVAKYAQQLRDFRLSTSTKNIAILQKKLKVLKTELNTLQAILKWAKE